MGINVGPLVGVFLADARSDYTFVEACKKRRTATVISAITERRHSQSVVQGFESPGCGQNEYPRRWYWAWEALDGLSCLTMIDVQELTRLNDFRDSNMINTSVNKGEEPASTVWWLSKVVE